MSDMFSVSSERLDGDLGVVAVGGEVDIYTAPRFKEGQAESPPYVTLLHNGVVVHNHTALLGPTGHRSLPKLRAHPPKGPVRLQDHGNPVRYRNIWVRELKGYDE